MRDLLDYSGNLLVVSDKWLRTRGGGVWGGSLGSMRGAGCAHVEGNYVYAGGELIGESSHTDGLARWDGSEWSRVGAGMAFRHDYGDLVQTVTSYDGDLFIGGKNTGARSVSYQEDDCYGTVLYDGGDILPMAPGLDPTFTSLVYQGDLYVGGEFNPSGLGLSRIARRGPAGWEALGAGVSQSAFSGAVYDLTEWQEKLILGGKFSQADGLTCDNLVAWDGAAFSLVDDADFSSDILAVCGFAGDLVVGGKFTSIDGAPMGRIARWDGLSWTNMNGGFDDYVECLEVWDGELYAGGRFSSADGVGTARVARWDGAAWQPLGMGMDGAEGVMALQDSDVGLFAGGDFTTAGGMPAAGVARWTGAAWEALGDGVTGGPIQPIVRDFCVHEGNL
ncbi:MAG: hypothetical protein GY736_18185, partial [Sphingomonas sp.]|uniref:hypothetical protein n=1 Tax=Sphingomonas sp. TaxID=28214 RepID=UPI00258F1EE3